MFKLKIEKQTDKGVEFVKDVEFQSVPVIRETIVIDDKKYVVKSIMQSPEHYIITVKDKLIGGITGLENL